MSLYRTEVMDTEILREISARPMSGQDRSPKSTRSIPTSKNVIAENSAG